MPSPPFRLGSSARRLVRAVIVEHCQRRGWDLLACSVRSNHVHIVVTNSGQVPEVILGQLKAWTARRLRETGLAGGHGRVWTRGGSIRYIWHEASVGAAVEYVVEGQDVPR